MIPGFNGAALFQARKRRGDFVGDGLESSASMEPRSFKRGKRLRRGSGWPICLGTLYCVIGLQGSIWHV